MTTEEIDFVDELQKHLNRLDWSQADLAKKSRLNKGMISRIFSRERKPTPETLQSIAEAINVPIEEIYRWAGLLPVKPEKDLLTEEAEYLLSQLPEFQRRQAVTFIRYLAEQKGGYATETMEKDEHP